MSETTPDSNAGQDPEPKPSFLNEAPALGLALCLLAVACLLGAWLLIQLGPNQTVSVTLPAPDGTSSSVVTTATVSCSSVMRGSGLDGDGRTKTNGLGSAQDDGVNDYTPAGDPTIDGETLYEIAGSSSTARLGSHLDPGLCDKLRARRIGHAGELSVLGVLLFGWGGTSISSFNARRRPDAV